MLPSCPSIDEWHRSVPRSVVGPTLFGIVVLLVWGLGFGVWAAVAPIDGAVVAPGSFVATGQNKTVQHLEGGIVREIMVKEGDLVEQGQTLLRLDEIAPKARLRRLELRASRLAAMEARLRAEARLETAFEIPVALLASKDDPEVAQIILRQKGELDARRNKLATEEEVLRKEIAGLTESIQGFEAQVVATRAQIDLFADELRGKEELLRRNLVRRTDVLAVRRAEARMTGELGQLLSRISDSRERIARAEQQIAQLKSAAVQKAVEELRLAETEHDDLKEQIRAARDIAERIEIAAPVRGVVVKLNHNTPGGVLAPGAPILDLLPINNDLVIESRVMPADISHVKEGQHAQVRISALNQRVTPMIDAHVVYVSADAVNEQDARKLAIPQATNQGMFVVRIRIDDADLRAKAGEFRPTPGMPADVFIRTEQRTFFQYLMKPIVDSFSRAFREN